MYIELVKNWISILCEEWYISIVQPMEEKINLAQTGSKDNNFVNLSHFLKKIVYARSFNDVDIMPMILDFDWDDIICLGYRLERG